MVVTANDQRWLAMQTRARRNGKASERIGAMTPAQLVALIGEALHVRDLILMRAALTALQRVDPDTATTVRQLIVAQAAGLTS